MERTSQWGEEKRNVQNGEASDFLNIKHGQKPTAKYVTPKKYPRRSKKMHLNTRNYKGKGSRTYK